MPAPKEDVVAGDDVDERYAGRVNHGITVICCVDLVNDLNVDM